MDPLADSPTHAALGAARRLLHDASIDAAVLRHRAEALADATDWRSRATDGYRAGIAALADDLARLVRLIGVSDEQAADAQHAPAGIALRRWS